MALNNCRICGASAVEEIRGEHHKDGKNPRNEKETVEVADEHNSDVRVHCTKCQNSTGWDRVDIERFDKRADGDYRRVCVTRDGNKDNIRKRWNDANPAKAAAA